MSSMLECNKCVIANVNNCFPFRSSRLSARHHRYIPAGIWIFFTFFFSLIFVSACWWFVIINHHVNEWRILNIFFAIYLEISCSLRITQGNSAGDILKLPIFLKKEKKNQKEPLLFAISLDLWMRALPPVFAGSKGIFWLPFLKQKLCTLSIVNSNKPQKRRNSLLRSLLQDKCFQNVSIFLQFCHSVYLIHRQSSEFD